MGYVLPPLAGLHESILPTLAAFYEEVVASSITRWLLHAGSSHPGAGVLSAVRRMGQLPPAEAFPCSISPPHGGRKEVAQGVSPGVWRRSFRP